MGIPAVYNAQHHQVLYRTVQEVDIIAVCALEADAQLKAAQKSVGIQSVHVLVLYCRHVDSCMRLSAHFAAALSRPIFPATHIAVGVIQPGDSTRVFSTWGGFLSSLVGMSEKCSLRQSTPVGRESFQRKTRDSVA